MANRDVAKRKAGGIVKGAQKKENQAKDKTGHKTHLISAWNIRLYYASIMFRSFFLLISINVLYYLTNGLSMTEVLLLASTMSIASVLLDIPTGMFADKYGRKTSIVISGILLIAGYSFLAFGSSFLAFFAAMIFLASSMSFISGADSAIIYDSLVSDGLEHKYNRIETMARTIVLAATALAAIAGSFLYTLEIHLPFYGMVLLASLASVCYLLMKEPPVESKEHRTILQYLKQSMLLMKKDRTVLFLILFQAFVFSSVNISYRFFQPLMSQRSIPTAMFGIVYAVLLLLSALIVYLQPSIEKKVENNLGGNAILWLVPVLLAAGFLLMTGPLLLLLIGLFLIQLVLPYMIPLMKTKMQALIPSRERATILSVMSFFGNLLQLIFAPVFGYLSDAFSISTSLFFLAVFGLAGTMAALLWHYNGKGAP